MRNATTLAMLAVLAPLWVGAQCTELFISEYCEGTGNNKGLEFFNPTGSPIDLGPYVLQRWSNGELGMTDETNLIGTIPAYGTWVLVNGQTEDVDLGGGATSPLCDPAMQNLADQLDNPYPAPTYMNGDDALVLIKNGNVVVDIFGKPGEDPGAAWTNDSENGFVDIGDGATWLTSNHTLRRKFEVTGGVTLPPVAFDTFLQWDTLLVNTWDNLGMHACACGGNEVDVLAIRPDATIYPNPSANGTFEVTANLPVERITVHTATGQLIHDEPINRAARVVVEVPGISAGAYIVNIHMAGGATFAHRWWVK
jgi:hypothetical protein